MNRRDLFRQTHVGCRDDHQNQTLSAFVDIVIPATDTKACARYRAALFALGYTGAPGGVFEGCK